MLLPWLALRPVLSSGLKTIKAAPGSCRCGLVADGSARLGACVCAGLGARHVGHGQRQPLPHRRGPSAPPPQLLLRSGRACVLGTRLDGACLRACLRGSTPLSARAGEQVRPGSRRGGGRLRCSAGLPSHAARPLLSCTGSLPRPSHVVLAHLVAPYTLVSDPCARASPLRRLCPQPFHCCLCAMRALCPLC